MAFEPTAKKKTSEPYPRRLYLIFSLLAIASALGLDYAAARRGERAYLFPPRAPREEAPITGVPLADSVRRFLGASGLPSEVVEESEDADGNLQLTARISTKDYESLASRLNRKLRNLGVSAEKEKGKEEGIPFYSWRMTGPQNETLVLVFSLLEPPERERAGEEAVPAPPENQVAIIIDDMGDSLEVLQEICDLGQPVTISILPLSLYAEETARMAHEKGLHVMLHLPGESLNHPDGNSLTAGLIRSGMSEEDVRSLVEASLSRVPYVEGVNNHMGSKITQEEPVMRPILEVLKSRDLFFLDSRTTADTIAFNLAREMGLRAGFRNVFLDSTVGVDYSKKKIIELFRLAQRTGRAIGIGHPFPETLRALKDNISLAKKFKVKPVFVSEIIPK
jgi:polysaccharide deacetylase 2 family uncharacterized protein YibQ